MLKDRGERAQVKIENSPHRNGLGNNFIYQESFFFSLNHMKRTKY